MLLQTVWCPYFRKAFAYSAPIGALAGLIGLGGGEFRLPVLMHVIGFSAKASVPINLMVSFITLIFAAAVRSQTVPITSIVPHFPEIFGLLSGGTVSAFWGVRLVGHLNDRRFAECIGVLLGVIGFLLLVEAVFPFRPVQLAGDWPTHLALGFAVGIVVGLVSSLLGVAGGELLIPSLMFIFGADIKTAGSASIMISLVIVAMGICRYHRMNAMPKGRGIRRIAFSMSGGSIVGALVGGLLAAMAPVAGLKILLGCVLVLAAAKTFSNAGVPS